MTLIAVVSMLLLSLHRHAVECREPKHLFVQRTQPVRGSSSPFRTILLDGSGNVAKEKESQHHAHIESSSKSRMTRSADNTPHETVHRFNDSHNMVFVHWSGFNFSDTVVVLSRDQRPTAKSTSYLYVSNNYGKTFTNQSKKLEYMKENKKMQALIDGMYNNPLSPKWYILTDITNNVLLYSKDDCETFVPVVLSFSPTAISFHPTKPKSLLAHDKNLMKLYYSDDFGSTWSEREDKVDTFYWGIENMDSDDTIYIAQMNSDQTSDVYRGHYNHKHPFFKHKIIANVSDFEINGNYMFATKKSGGGLDLYVSYHYHNFEIASFPLGDLNQDYIIADTSEDQVFVAINHNKNTTHLYVSDSTGKKYTLSLERLLYYNPNHRKETWIRYYMNETFIDFHPVASMRGVYIASQVSVGEVGTRYVYTRITYNKGGYWLRLRSPRFHANGSLVNCSYWRDECSLHLVQKFVGSHPGHHASQVTSKKSAPGLIVSSGNIGQTVSNRNVNLYVSNDAGYTWREALDGRYYFTFADHGGVIVAAKQWSSTKQLFYSVDEGISWNSYNFTKQDINIYGIITETGEKTSIISIYGSYSSGGHHWIVVQVDFSAVFDRPCSTGDYETWSPEDVGYGRNCILGEKLVFERRKQKSKCFNGRNYDRPISKTACSCTWTDFECDEGFYKPNDWYYCAVDPRVPYNPEAPPRPCPFGQTYNKTQGYRKIPNDKCANGSSIWYLPYEESCPFKLDKAFLVYASYDSIKYYDLVDTTHKTKIFGLRGAVAIAYDIEDGFVYWADMQDHKIFRQMLNQTDERLVIAGIKQIEGMDLDPITGYLYWVDSKEKVIEVCQKDGLFRKTIHSSDLDKPRAIALDPPKGKIFWSDWGDQAKIEVSFTDGTGRQTLVSGSKNVVWPNGLAIDVYKTTDGKYIRTLYWTDAKLDIIGKYDFSTQKVSSFAKKSGKLYSALNHPYSIAVDDRNVYWDDWSSGSIYKLPKSGNGELVELVKGKQFSSKRKYEIKVYYNRTVEVGTRFCSKEHGCLQLCLSNDKSFNCSCADDMITVNKQCACKGNLQLFPNGTCARKDGQSCASDEFSCRTNRRCIPLRQVCDGKNDCGDHSDEPTSCNKTKCDPGYFTCPNGGCIPMEARCNGYRDCISGADEFGCRTSKYSTPTGTGEHTATPKQPTRKGTDKTKCDPGYFTCPNGGCIPMEARCNGHRDCISGADEIGCRTSKYSTPTGTGEHTGSTGSAAVAMKQSSSGDKKKVLIWAIPVALVFAALLIGLIYFAVKSRRLQRSFYHLIRSDSFDGGVAYHNTGDDNDVPLIQGFSDDDPLVEA